MAGEILLGYDGQDGSRAALRAATTVAAAFQRTLIVVFGYDPPPLGGDRNDLRAEVREIGERITAEAVQSIHTLDPNVKVEIELVDDRPVEAILRAADEHDAFAIVVGTAGRGPIAGTLLGSVTYQLAHRTKRPLLVVPTGDDDHDA